VSPAFPQFAPPQWRFLTSFVPPAGIMRDQRDGLFGHLPPGRQASLVPIERRRPLASRRHLRTPRISDAPRRQSLRGGRLLRAIGTAEDDDDDDDHVGRSEVRSDKVTVAWNANIPTTILSKPREGPAGRV
jgi:hypothetical protein